jgi:autoinducer 2 (AI-2) kinase
VNKDHLLAIDAGTGSCRAVLFDHLGRQIAVAQREWRHPSLHDVPGSQVFETGPNWRLICLCVREAIAKAGIPAARIAAVSSTSMREGIVLYDRNGEEIWACPNVDSRAAAEATELIRRGLADEIYATAGDWVAITSAPRLLWLQRHEPEIVARAAHLTMLGDWILYRLSGCYVTDPSLGSSSGLFDLAAREWSGHLLEICGLRAAVCPGVLEPGTVIGGVTGQAADETGLAEGTPVVVGGADTQLGLVGIGTIVPGQCTVVGGTFWQQTVTLDTPLIDPRGRLRTLCHTVPGQWMMEGIGFYSGLAMRWLRDAFCQDDVERALAQGVDAYVLMEEAAAQAPPGANGVIGIFSNVMNARRWVHASPAFMQFDVTNPHGSGRKECIRAVEESAAYVSRSHLETIRALTGLPLAEIVFTGGAAKGHLWPQILADVLNARVRVPVVKESTALGAALYAGLGAGLYTDLSAALADVVRFERTYEPDADRHERYRSLFEQWSHVYERSLLLVQDGLLRPLWRAAGT